MPFIFVFILWLGLEVAGIWLVGEAIDSLGMAIWIAIGTSFIGLSVLSRAKNMLASPEVMGAVGQMAGGPESGVGKIMAPFFGGLLLTFPGFISDLLGVLLLIPFTRTYLSKFTGMVAKKAAVAAMKRQGFGGGAMDLEQLKKMMEQQGGGNPFGGSNPFGQGPSRSAPPPPSSGGGAGGRGKIRDADFEVLD